MSKSFNNPIKFVASGFPSPADDFAKPSLDLNSYIVEHPSATFFMRVEGNAHKEIEIYDGDILVVDRALTPRAKSLLVLSSDEGLKIVSYEKVSKQLQDLWGVATYIIRKL